MTWGFVKRTIAQRFRARYIILDNGCWEWQGTKTNGYGTFCVDYQRYAAHRYSYIAHKGPIPEGMQIDHLCKKRDCVNPEHLEAVTPIENVQRSDTFGAIAHRTGVCKNGHLRTHENTRPQGKNPNWRICRLCETNKREHEEVCLQWKH